jgi:hypothetical protein
MTHELKKQNSLKVFIRFANFFLVEKYFEKHVKIQIFEIVTTENRYKQH